jgi:hypothetical protein
MSDDFTVPLGVKLYPFIVITDPGLPEVGVKMTLGDEKLCVVVINVVVAIWVKTVKFALALLPEESVTTIP